MAKIIGGTTSTPMRVPDWNQTDPTKSDYIKNKPDLGAAKEWEEIANTTLTEAVAYWEIKPNGRFTEVFIECKYTMELPTENSTTVTFSVGCGTNYITRNELTVKNGDVIGYRARGTISPSKKMIYDAVASKFRFTTLSSNCSDPTPTNFEYFDNTHSIRLSTKEMVALFGAGSTIQIWGR